MTDDASNRVSLVKMINGASDVQRKFPMVKLTEEDEHLQKEENEKKLVTASRKRAYFVHYFSKIPEIEIWVENFAFSTFC